MDNAPADLEQGCLTFIEEVAVRGRLIDECERAESRGDRRTEAEVRDIRAMLAFRDAARGAIAQPPASGVDRGALRPFAKAADAYESFDGQHDFSDDHVVAECGFQKLTVGDLRHAREALTNSGSPASVADREAFKAGWRTNAVGEETHPASYLDGCEQVDWEEYSRLGISQYLEALTNSGAPVPGDAKAAELPTLPSGDPDHTDCDGPAGGGRFAHPALAANPVPGDAGGAERICREAAQWELAQAATPGIGKKTADNHRSAAHALEMVADKIAAHAAPAPSDGPGDPDLATGCADDALPGSAEQWRDALEPEAGVPAGMVLVPVGLLYAAVETYEGEWGEANNPDSWPNRMKAMLAAAPKQATPTDEAVLAELGASLIFDAVWERFCEGDFEIEINDLITVTALSCGIVKKVPFDPEEHVDVSGSCEAGDDYYMLTEVGEKLIDRAKSARSAPGSAAAEGTSS